MQNNIKNKTPNTKSLQNKKIPKKRGKNRILELRILITKTKNIIKI